MTNKEAINILSSLPLQAPSDSELVDIQTAVRTAIKALERDGTLSYDEVITSGFACPVCGAIWRKGVEE